MEQGTRYNPPSLKLRRIQGFDYSSPGKYFITICTKNKIPYFGKIENGEMILSELGQIAEKYWRKIPNHFRYVKLDEFIIMPDHLHGNPVSMTISSGTTMN
ncbi:MAG: hypothetical protein MUO72_02415 [Bacteroidales bacterium]|nr:hypothetical protein [Bacteroidales bacterium]